MSDYFDCRKPLKILNVDGRSLQLDEHGLARLLLDERVKDKPVVVIAVAGAFRKGKSFLLCFLLRYLESKGRADWLGDPNAPLKGFDWRGGSERHTAGILMWNEVFLVKTSRGEELAVLLMDTQGTFDCESPSVVHASIFSLGAMISSVLVFNVSQNIQENDLQHLQDFIEYGMLTMSEQQQSSSTMAELDCTQPFQSLMFLVRDWQYAYEEPYGLEGGKKLLKKRLKVTRGQDEELRQLRKKLSKCFRKMRCFLLPYPGSTVAQKKFDGRLSVMDEQFKRHLSDFVRLLLEADNLLPKKIGGRKITCQELLSYIKVYVSASKGGLLEDPSKMLEVTHAGSCRAAMDKSMDFYTTSMISLWQDSPDDDADHDTMRGHHNKLREVALEKYSAAPKMGGELQAKVYLHKLQENMDATFDVYCEYLKKKKTFFIAAAFKHLAFKVVHGFLTAGLSAAAIALAVVELPIVAGVLGALGAASLSGHLIQTIVEMTLAKRKRKERLENSKLAKEAAKRRGICAPDIDDEDTGTWDDTCDYACDDVCDDVCDDACDDACDDVTPALAAEDDNISVRSFEQAESAATSLQPSCTATVDVAATEAANSEAYARAIKRYTDGMQQVCGDSMPRFSDEELQGYHSLVQVYARETLIKGCSSAGTSVLPRFEDRLTDEMEEQFKNFFNQNREKPTTRT